MKYTPVIGLEIHVELSTKNKMFCQCSADWFGKEPNSHTCPVCLGLPGALPVPNKQAIEWTIKMALALGCNINKTSKFDRKHYFYPDLPKGYQISQYDEPIGINGEVHVGEKKFRIRRVHLEEDTGKLIHEDRDTLVDFNRSGVPLVEIVTEPDFDSSQDAKQFLEELHAIITTLQVSDVNMQEGSMRLEPNISLRKQGEKKLPFYKVEVKNINSFRYVQQAIDYEVKRQTEILESGKTPIQETRGYNENKKITFSQRVKEEAEDYRYFPEPDIPPLQFNEKDLEAIKVPELPWTVIEKLKKYKINEEDVRRLSQDSLAVVCFKKAVAELKANPQTIANLIINKKVNLHKDIEKTLEEIKEKLAPKTTDLQELDGMILKMLEENLNAVADYKKGKENALMFLVGQIMKAMEGKADASIVKEKLLEKLKS